MRLLEAGKGILTPSGYPPTGKGLGALICVLNMPYELGYQMYLTLKLAYEHGNWKTGKQQNTDAEKQGSNKGWTQGSTEAETRGTREAEKKGSRIQGKKEAG